MSSSDLAPMWTPPLNESAESEIKVPLWGEESIPGTESGIE